LGSSTSPVSRRALKFYLKSVASAIPPRPRELADYFLPQSAPDDFIGPFQGFLPGFVSSLGLFLLWICSHFVDRRGVKLGLEVHCVILLNHPDAGAAILGDLVDVGALQQA